MRPPTRIPTVRQRLRTFTLVALAFLGGLGVLSFWALDRLVSASEKILATQSILRRHLEADMAHDAVHAATLSAVVAGEEISRLSDSARKTAAIEASRPKIHRTFAEETEILRAGLDAIDAADLNATTHALAQESRPRMNLYVSRCQAVVELSFRDIAAARAAITDMEASFEQVKTDLAVLSDAIESVAQSDQKSGERLAFVVRLLIPLAVLSAAVALSLLAIRLRRSIADPLAQAARVAAAVARGDLTIPTENSSAGDEIGQVQVSLHEMVGSLSQIVQRVRQGATEIDSTAREVSAGNVHLARRTEAQAATVEETAASLEELSATVRQSAALAREARELSLTASTIATDGGKAVDGVVTTMNEIEVGSRKIVDIITLIDEIAFRTNILALNAALEAARAGEQGKGFAVVASEVRRLAGRAAASAQQIRELIEDAVERVTEGNRQVSSAGAVIQDTVESVEKVSRLMAEIANATQEQSLGLEQINLAITRLDDVAQQNGAMVEQASAATSSLEDQAHRLVEMVRMFEIDEAAAS